MIGEFYVMESGTLKPIKRAYVGTMYNKTIIGVTNDKGMFTYDEDKYRGSYKLLVMADGYKAIENVGYKFNSPTTVLMQKG